MNKKVYNLIIVDESGSMSIIRQQALAGMNETLDTIRKVQDTHGDIEQHVTLLTFDSTHTTFVYDDVLAANTRVMTLADYNPGGATPLYDAIGIGISKLNAITAAGDNVLVTIITDGQENCSREYNLRMVKNLIDKLKTSGWTFTFIGTDNLDVEGMAADMGISNHLAFAQTEAGTRAMFKREKRSRERFYDFMCLGKIMDEGDYFNGDDEEDNSNKR